MNKYPIIVNLFLTIAFVLSGCGKSQESDVQAQFQALLDESNAFMQDQNAEGAMQKAIEALTLADANSMTELSVEAMNSIASIDLVTMRDDHAWDFASKAESICRANSLSRNLARALLIKARVCIYADVSPETSRNDEALTYLDEALNLALELSDFKLQIDAYYSFSQVYVNKNRWNDVIDMNLFNLASSNLTKGETLAASFDYSDLIVKGMQYRVRLLRQASKYDEAIEYCNSILQASRENDFLARYQAYEQLTTLYYIQGDNDRAYESHQNTLQNIRQYMTQKSDDRLQDMETRYEVAIKEQKLSNSRYQIVCLCLALALFVILAYALYRKSRRANMKNQELEHKGKVKDELISFLSNDLDLPALEKDKDSLDEAVADYVNNVIEEKNRNASSLGLTRRELEILRMSAKGKSAAQMASDLHLSLRTINNHKYNIFTKMGVGSTTEMIAKARELGMV